MTEPVGPTAESDIKYHTYETASIPWVVRLLWIGFWVGCIWYIVRLAIPSAKNYF